MKSLRKAGSNEICTVLGDEENLDPVRSAVDPEAYDDYRRLWDEAGMVSGLCRALHRPDTLVPLTLPPGGVM